MINKARDIHVPYGSPILRTKLSDLKKNYYLLEVLTNWGLETNIKNVPWDILGPGRYSHNTDNAFNLPLYDLKKAGKFLNIIQINCPQA